MNLLLADPILSQSRSSQNALKPTTLAILFVGNHAESELYVSIKQRQAPLYNVTTNLIRFPATTSTDTLKETVQALNRNPAVDALIVQLPLPPQCDTDRILELIQPSKDVDNLSGQNTFMSPMVLSVQALKEYYNLDFTGKKLCVVGQGRLVGKPITEWLKQQGYEPVSIDEETDTKDALITEADVIFAGTGQPNVVTAANTQAGQIIFDCSGKDVDFEAVKDKAAWITPPKGSIGPLTIHFLFMNVLQSNYDK
jgi:methylenetetrahydrofolate dehydrogenase (NADP+)/methenyltetrahydrofolate cyclohydrolase